MSSIDLKPISTIKANLGFGINSKIQKFFTNTCYKHMDKYVPKDKDNLRTIVEEETNAIIYESPYARYQYKGMRDDGSYVVKNYTTPGTGPYWDKRMVSAEIDDVIKETSEYARRS